MGLLTRVVADAADIARTCARTLDALLARGRAAACHLARPFAADDLVLAGVRAGAHDGARRGEPAVQLRRAGVASALDATRQVRRARHLVWTCAVSGAVDDAHAVHARTVRAALLAQLGSPRIGCEDRTRLLARGAIAVEAALAVRAVRRPLAGDRAVCEVGSVAADQEKQDQQRTPHGCGACSPSATRGRGFSAAGRRPEA